MMDTEKIGTALKDMETLEEKTIILWGQDDMLIRAVEDLLITGKGWKVIRISNDCDEVALAQMVEQVTPDVLIVHESAFACNVRLLIKFVMDYSRLKILTIGLENNQMEIYIKQRIYIKKASDLLAAIENEADTEI